MPTNPRRTKRSEKGLLTLDNSVVAIIDLQPKMLFGVANFDRQTIIKNNIVLSKAARVFDVPAVLSTVGQRASAEICGRRSKPSSPTRTRSSARP